MTPRFPVPALAAILHEVWGYEQFRDRQQEVVSTVANGGNALVLMPTGGGKSVCYQLPAIARHRAGLGFTLVVSPLIALMHDQIQALAELGVAAKALNSSLTGEEANQIERALLNDALVLLYAAPERVNTPRFLGMLESLAERGKFGLIAIDEAHCVSQWGHDFRPEYVTLAALAERFPTVPRMALTATADAHTRADMLDRLALTDAPQFISSFDRPNIQYHIHDKQDPRRQLLAFLSAQGPDAAGIVYCMSRKKVDETAAWLELQGYKALPYHAGLDTATRRINQDRFLAEDGVVMCATIAFGMGIDKPDVRFVAHLDMPKNIEGYYQETGRAGRDGLPAQAWMVYDLSDVVQQRRMIEEGEAGEDFKRILATKLEALLGLAESASCRRVSLLAYFGQASQPCGNCDNCLTPPALWDATEAARKALSAVYRTGQRFGAGHVIDVLGGKLTEKARQFGHERLPVFGVGRDLAESQWRAVLRQLLARGALQVGEFQSLHLAGDARQILKGELTLQLRVAGVKPAKAPKAMARSQRGSPGQIGSKPAPDKGLQQFDPHMLERLAALKAWRLETARAHSVPAYVIFHDSVLHDLAEQAPSSLADLDHISGIGSRKRDAYGADLLNILQGLQRAA
jgi:ATP-dependent DNA helicase RecQ